MLERFFKKTQYITLPRENTPREQTTKTGVPCPVCQMPGEVQKPCVHCGALRRLNQKERLAQVVDPESFTPFAVEVGDDDPLSFPGYADKKEKARRQSGFDEAVLCGTCTIAGVQAAIGIMDATFMMGSLGRAVGEHLAVLFERATAMQLPVVLFTASGGARMQEGIYSLMQMAKVTAALERHDRAGLLVINILTDPTTGGVTASFAMLGDILLAEPGTLIGFAGARVIAQTTRQSLPEGFQRAEFLLKKGFLDALVPRQALGATLAHLLTLHGYGEVACGA